MTNVSGIYGLIAILICVIIIITLIFGIVLIYIYNSHKKILEGITEYEIDVNASINEEIPKILELYVQTIFDDYRAKFLEAQDIDYITSEKEKEITKDVSRLCADRLSPAMAHKLSLFWNPETIGSVIADKIYLIVVGYVAQHNSVKEIPSEFEPKK